MSLLSSIYESKQRAEQLETGLAHIPLSEAALCAELECGAVFNVKQFEGCPACGCSQLILLASWIKPLQDQIEESRWPEDHCEQLERMR